MAICFAYVMYSNGVKKIVSTKCLENHFPKNKQDFVLNQRYKIWFNGDKGKSDLLLNGFILLLGESKKDVLNQKNQKRLKFPNKRNMSFSSISSNDRSKAGRTQKTKVAKISKTKLQTDAMQHNSNQILKKHLNLMKQRKTITDDSSDSDEMEMSDKNNEQDKLHHLQSSDTHMITDGEDLNNDDKSSFSGISKLHLSPHTSSMNIDLRELRSPDKQVTRSSLLSERRESCLDETQKRLSSVLKNTGVKGNIMNRRSNCDDMIEDSDTLHSTEYHTTPSASREFSRERSLEHNSDFEGFRSRDRTPPASTSRINYQHTTTTLKEISRHGRRHTTSGDFERRERSRTPTRGNDRISKSLPEKSREVSREGSLEHNSDFEGFRSRDRTPPASTSRVNHQHTTSGDSERFRTPSRENHRISKPLPTESRERQPLTGHIELNEDKIHLGENIYVHIDIWETMLRKNDSKFVRDLSEVIWSRATLRKRCLQESKTNKENASEESFRKQLTPKKYKLLQQLLYKKISDAGVRGAAREARMRKVSKYMSAKLYDVNRRLKK